MADGSFTPLAALRSQPRSLPSLAGVLSGVVSQDTTVTGVIGEQVVSWGGDCTTTVFPSDSDGALAATGSKNSPGGQVVGELEGLLLDDILVPPPLSAALTGGASQPAAAAAAAADDGHAKIITAALDRQASIDIALVGASSAGLSSAVRAADVALTQQPPGKSDDDDGKYGTCTAHVDFQGHSMRDCL